jgi:hypothetical protein
MDTSAEQGMLLKNTMLLLYSVVQKGWPLMHHEPSALSNQLFGCQPLKAKGSLVGKVHPFRERL